MDWWYSVLLYRVLPERSTKVFWQDLAPIGRHISTPWWRYQMQTFSALLAICSGNLPVTGEFSAQRPVTWSFDVFFDQRMNKRLSKQSWGWWFQTPSLPLWRHCSENLQQAVILQAFVVADVSHIWFWARYNEQACAISYKRFKQFSHVWRPQPITSKTAVHTYKYLSLFSIPIQFFNDDLDRNIYDRW